MWSECVDGVVLNSYSMTHCTVVNCTSVENISDWADCKFIVHEQIRLLNSVCHNMNIWCTVSIWISVCPLKMNMYIDVEFDILLFELYCMINYKWLRVLRSQSVIVSWVWDNTQTRSPVRHRINRGQHRLRGRSVSTIRVSLRLKVRLSPGRIGINFERGEDRHQPLAWVDLLRSIFAK